MVSEYFNLKNRTIFDSVEVVLECAKTPVYLTLLMRMSGIRYQRIQSILSVCLEKNLLEIVTDIESRKCYKTTIRGHSYLTQLNKLKTLLNHKVRRNMLIQASD